MATGTSLSPTCSRWAAASNERGVLEVGGCDAIELAQRVRHARVRRRRGGPARPRARLRRRRARASATRTCTSCSPPRRSPARPCWRCSQQEGLWCDVASGGELHLALNAGFAPERIVLHGNAKSEAELRMALRHRVGLIVLDNFDEIERLARAGGRGRARRPRGRPAGAGPRHARRARRDAREDLDRPGRLQVRLLGRRGAARRSSARGRPPGSRCRGVHAHIGSQLLDLEPVPRARAPSWRTSDRRAGSRSGTSGAASACATPPTSRRRPRSRSTSGALVAGRSAHGRAAARC